MAESGGRAVERKLTLPVTPDAAMIGVKPMFSGRSLGDGANADFDVVMAAPDGKTLAQVRACITTCSRSRPRYQWYRQNGQWQYEPVKRTERVANGTLDVAADKPARLSLPVKWGRYRLEVSTGEPNGPVTSLGFDAGFYAESSADTPDLLEVALDKPDYKSGEAMNVAVTARTAGRLTVNVFTDRLVASQSQDVKPGAARVSSPSAAIGAPAPIWSRPCAVRSMRRRSACRAAPSACNGSRSTVGRAHACARHEAAGDACGRIRR